MKRINQFLRLATVGTLALTICLTACRKKSANDEVEVDPDLTSERDLSNANNDQNSLLKDIDKALDNSSANLREEAFGSYFTSFEKDSAFTKDGVDYTRYLLVTYTGTSDDGQSRSGEMKIFSVGKRTLGNFKAYATFTGTKVGGRSITGTKKITQQASGDSNKWQFGISANGSITTIDGKIITYSSNRTRIRTGISTLANLLDDSITITGSWTGTNGNGESVTSVISSPLQMTYLCHVFREITSGKIDFTNTTKGTSRTINYGSGGCDGKGTFTNAKGRVFEFYFKR